MTKIKSNLQNDRLIKALLRQPVDRTPIWMMRQAGRYLPEYRALREKTPDFLSFCKTPELACEATLQPLARFPLDAAIIFSDILTIPAALGLDLRFIEGEGPVINNPIRNERDVNKLPSGDVINELDYVMEAINLAVKDLAGKVPLIGFAGSPWTVATYMVEGGSSKLFQTIKTLMYREPQVMHTLLHRITDVTIAYLNAQVKAGAQVLMVFDSWGGILSHYAYHEFSLKYMKKIAKGITRQVGDQQIPLIFFTKGGGLWLEDIAESGCDALGLDWTINLASAHQRVGNQVALQGNLDPMVLLSNPEAIQSAVQRILKAAPEKGYVFNLGHGIHKDTPIEHVEVMIQMVQEKNK